MVLPHEVFNDRRADTSSVYRRLRPLPQEVFRESFDKGDISKSEFEVLTHNWCVMENIRTGLGIGNNVPFLIEGSISGRFIPNSYDDIAYNLLNESWNYLLCAAPSGMGKSVKLRSHAEQINCFYGLPVMRADRKPPWEDTAARFPTNDPDGCDRLRRWNFAPMGLGRRLILLKAPSVSIEATELKVDLKSIWESLEVDEELADSFHKVFAVLFEVKQDGGQQGANALLDFIMSARPNTFNGLMVALDNKKQLMSTSKERFDNYFYSRVKRCRRYIVNTSEERIDIDALLLKSWSVFLRGNKTLRPFFSLATDLFEGSTKHAFTEYYFHTLFYRLLKNGSLPALWDVNDEVDATRSSPLLRELGFWKARKLRALHYCSESATQDVKLFTDDMRQAAQSIQFGGAGNNKEFAEKYAEGMDFNVLVDIKYLAEKEWCLVNQDKGFHVVYKKALPSFCAYPVRQRRLMA
jgi:hypothetical protein